MAQTGKPFTSIENQVAILRRRGVLTDEETPKILLREGYYSVVNGYKDPFLDRKNCIGSDDRYKTGTRFSDIYDLFQFDRDLREVTFHYLLKVEALMRTICTYTFSEAHLEPDAYLRSASFAEETEYLAAGLKDYDGNIHELHRVMRSAIRHPRNDAVRYYIEERGYVPLWVLMSTLTFGNVEHFFNLMKPEEQKLVCKRIVKALSEEDGSRRGYLAPITARRALDILVKYRNKCAHDERLYCARVGYRREINFKKMMEYAAIFLTESELDDFLRKVLLTVIEYSKKSGKVAHVLRETGFEMKA